MITIDIIQKFAYVIEKEAKILSENALDIYSKLKVKSKDFIKKIEEEGSETKEAFEILRQSVLEDKELTDEQKEQIGSQLKDVLKTIGLVSLASLPGGSLFFVLFNFFKLNKYVFPSSFTEQTKTPFLTMSLLTPLTKEEDEARQRLEEYREKRSVFQSMLIEIWKKEKIKNKK